MFEYMVSRQLRTATSKINNKSFSKDLTYSLKGYQEHNQLSKYI